MFSLDHTIALLSATPASLEALLHKLPDSWTHRNEGGDTWTVFDVIGHLIHGEHTDWIPRVQFLLEFSDTRPFPPFDRMGHKQLIAGKSMPALLEEFASARTASLRELQQLKLQPQQLELRGRHPAFGPVTLSQLLATWSVHDLNHIHQISRIMARQYGEAVGPWEKYLGVLHCEGHSGAA